MMIVDPCCPHPELDSEPAQPKMSVRPTLLSSGVISAAFNHKRCEMTKPLIGINCDHFADATHGKWGLRPYYLDALERAGAIPVLAPPLAEKSDMQAFVARCDGFVMSGGDDLVPGPASRKLPHSPLHPKREQADRLWWELLLDLPKPVLAICLGMQQLNLVLGGELYYDLTTEWPENGPPLLRHYDRLDGGVILHQAHPEPGSELAAWADGAEEITVTSSHHQAVRTPGAGLEVVARASDGVIEAVTMPAHHWLTAVQWHPEQMPGDPVQAKLFAAFLQKA